MNIAEFRNGLTVKSGKSFVIFEANQVKDEELHFNYSFNRKNFKEFLTYLKEEAKMIWKGFKPQIAKSEGSDYYEYYDKELGNNGYLRIIEGGLFIQRPSKESNRLYKFNKRKLESFIYDLEQHLVDEKLIYDGFHS